MTVFELQRLSGFRAYTGAGRIARRYSELKLAP